MIAEASPRRNRAAIEMDILFLPCELQRAAAFFSGLRASCSGGLRPLHSTPPTQRIAHKPGLRGEADRGIRSTEAGVGAPLDELKEKSAVEGLGVDLEIFSFTMTVVEHVFVQTPDTC